jgi:glycosyltransferase involved in cell wall biosynthesis
MNPIIVDVCAYDGPDSVGGPYVWIQRLPLRLRGLGFNVRIKLFTWQEPAEGAAFRALSRYGFEVSVAKFEDTVSNIRWLLSEMQPHPPDLFVANHVVPAYYAGKYLKRCGIPTIGILRSDDPFYWGLSDRFIFGHKADRMSGIVCVSDYLRQRVLERRPEAVEIRRIASGTPLPAKVAAPPGETLSLAYVGRLVEEQKRVSELAHALARVTKEIKGVDAVLFGEGPARSNVEQILAREEAGAVRLAGQIQADQIQERLLQCHVIVLLSDYEGTPMAVMEAMACGCVPVCLRIRSGIPELVEDGVTGLLVDDRGDSFVNAIRRLRDEPGLWERLSRAARAKIEHGYSLQVCGQQWADLLHTLHAHRGPEHPIKIPRRIRLPPTHPGFAHQDPRPASTPLAVRLYRRTRMAAGRWRRQLLGQPLP